MEKTFEWWGISVSVPFSFHMYTFTLDIACVGVCLCVRVWVGMWMYVWAVRACMMCDDYRVVSIKTLSVCCNFCVRVCMCAHVCICGCKTFF